MKKLHSDDAGPPPFSRPVQVARLRRVGDPIALSEQADEAERRATAELLDLASLAELSVEGALIPYRKDGWRFDGRVRADYAQTCVVTLEPAPGRLDEPLERIWLTEKELAADAAFAAAQEGMVDPDEGEEPELLPETLDLAAAAVEALSLSLDPYPRAPGAELETDTAAPPGAEPLDAEAVKPFAGLAALKERMEADAEATKRDGDED